MTDNSERKAKLKKILAALKLAVLAFIIIGLPAIIYVRYRSTFFSADAAGSLISYLESHSSVSVPMLILLQIFQVVVCFIPGQPIQFAASYMFGIFPALIISVGGAVIGAAIAFFLARILGQDAMHVLFDEEKITYYRDKLNSAKAIIIVFIIYLIPGIPKDLTSYAAGISEMRFMPFLIASTLGRTPSMFCSILFGYFLKAKNYAALIILSVTVGIIVIVCFIKRKSIYAYIDQMAEKGDFQEDHNGEG